MAFVIIYLVTFGLALIAGNMLFALAYALVALIALTVGQLFISAALSSFVPKASRVTHVNGLLAASQALTAILMIAGSYYYRPRLLAAACAAALSMWLVLRESDKALARASS